jgi:hypothetical protein
VDVSVAMAQDESSRRVAASGDDHVLMMVVEPAAPRDRTCDRHKRIRRPTIEEQFVVETATVQPDHMTGLINSDQPQADPGPISEERMEEIIARILGPENVEVAAFNSAI